MSTNSNVGKMNEDGTITAIYVHWDGHPDSVGVTLRGHYTNIAKIDQLLSLGALSILGPEIGVKHNFDEHNANVCTAFHRDRDEDLEIDSFLTIEDFCSQEYNYLWTGQKWIGFEYDNPLPESEMWG